MFRATRLGGSFFGSSDTPQVFFSRRIGLDQGETVPILGGGRLTGKSGPFTIGALNILTDDAPEVGALSTNFTVLRVKRDILRRSRIGGIFTGRSVSTTGNGSTRPTASTRRSPSTTTSTSRLLRADPDPGHGG